MARRTQTLGQQIAAITAKEKKLARQREKLQAKVDDIRREAENRRLMAEAAKIAADEAAAVTLRIDSERIAILDERTKTEFCIAVESDMGEVIDIWFPPVSSKELEAHWLSVPVAWAAGADDLFKVALGGEWVYDHEYGRSGGDLLYSVLKTLYIPTRYTASFGCGDPPYLQAPDGRQIFDPAYRDDEETMEYLAGQERDFLRWRQKYLAQL